MRQAVLAAPDSSHRRMARKTSTRCLAQTARNLTRPMAFKTQQGLVVSGSGGWGCGHGIKGVRSAAFGECGGHGGSAQRGAMLGAATIVVENTRHTCAECLHGADSGRLRQCGHQELHPASNHIERAAAHHASATGRARLRQRMDPRCNRCRQSIAEPSHPRLDPTLATAPRPQGQRTPAPSPPRCS